MVVPTGKFATLVVPKLAFPKVTPTALLVHVPVPTLGILPVNVVVGAHIVWFAPAIEVVGATCLVTLTCAKEGVQAPLLTVQRNVFTPSDRLLTVLVGKVGLSTVAVPLTTVQAPDSPLPALGVEPVSVTVVAHTIGALAFAVTPVGAS